MSTTVALVVVGEKVYAIGSSKMNHFSFLPTVDNDSVSKLKRKKKITHYILRG